MSGLWTPGGGGPPRQPEPQPEPDPDPDPAELEAALQEELAAMRNTPAAVVIGNHAIHMFELARIHLTAEPPNFVDAQLAIDAMAGIVEGLAGRLGDDERTLADGLAQIRLAFVQIKAAEGAKEAGVPRPEGTEAS
jgi:hypothetical protein